MLARQREQEALEMALDAKKEALQSAGPTPKEAVAEDGETLELVRDFDLKDRP
jgi:hypothetical protein